MKWACNAFWLNINFKWHFMSIMVTTSAPWGAYMPHAQETPRLLNENCFSFEKCFLSNHLEIESFGYVLFVLLRVWEKCIVETNFLVSRYVFEILKIMGWKWKYLLKEPWNIFYMGLCFRVALFLHFIRATIVWWNIKVFPRELRSDSILQMVSVKIFLQFQFVQDMTITWRNIWPSMKQH